MRQIFGLVISLCGLGAALPLAAQDTPLISGTMDPVKLAPAQAKQGATSAPLPSKLRLDAGTPLQVILEEHLSTKTHAIGDRFRFSVAENVSQGGVIIIPEGTSGYGELSRVVTKGAFGKSGKLEARMLYLTLNGRTVRVSGILAAQGEGNTTETVATAILAGTLAFAITGRSADLAAGSRLTAMLEHAVEIEVSRN